MKKRMSVLKTNNLARFPGLIHGFTTREPGGRLALGADYPRIAKELGVPEEAIVTLKQVHSDRVFVLENNRSYATYRTYTGDALVTGEKGTIIAVRTADCVPILLYDPDHRVIAAVHAGWRGVIAGVIENTIAVMKGKFKTAPSNLVVAMGAALCPGCFEIGPEVADAFRKKYGSRLAISSGKGDKSYLDLRKACEITLNDPGVRSEKIEVLSHCTACEPDLFYSYRRGDKDGRMFGFIGLIN